MIFSLFFLLRVSHRILNLNVQILMLATYWPAQMVVSATLILG